MLLLEFPLDIASSGSLRLAMRPALPTKCSSKRRSARSSGHPRPTYSAGAHQFLAISAPLLGGDGGPDDRAEGHRWSPVVPMTCCSSQLSPNNGTNFPLTAVVRDGKLSLESLGTTRITRLPCEPKRSGKRRLLGPGSPAYLARTFAFLLPL